MEIVESYHHRALKTDSVTMANRYRFMVYDLSDALVTAVEEMLLPGKTLVLFSGSWRLELWATYVEIKQFAHCGLAFHPNTLFVDHQSHWFDYLLEKFQPVNLLILHNDWWVGHRPLNQLVEMIDDLYQHVQSQNGQVILTLPLIHVNFNKLTMNTQDLLNATNGTLIDDSLIVCKR